MTIIKLILIGIYVIICSIFAIIFIITDRSHKLYFKLSKVFSKGILFISGIKVTVSGIENVPTDTPCVYVSNHSSMYDIPALQATFPNRAGMVFKKELAKIPIFGWQLKWGPYIMIDRENPEKAMKSIERAKLTMAEQNISVLLFAEGTRSKTGEVQPFKRGAFYLAARVPYPIVPVSVSGTSKIMPKGEFRIVKGSIHVHYDKPIYSREGMSKPEELALMENVRNIVISNKRD
ncbi:MAG: 1-acyl-sn-glycerol-3-phosphate acyltransferase [Ignavibacteriaceae bacterium]|nr:1-acyl-sn-glycerol-3-phosphate acyltransferase [Ignavibacteriaceae bacterium]